MKIPSIKQLLVLALFLPAICVSQDRADSLYTAARQAAFEAKDNSLAIEFIKQALDLTPKVDHYRVFYGRVLAWEAKYPESETQLKTVLDDNPRHLDARLALLDVYLWSGKYPQMEETAHSGLEIYPENADILFRLGMAQLKMAQARSASKTFNAVLILEPGHEQAQVQLLLLKDALKERKLRLSYAYDRLADTQTAWQFLVTEASLDPWVHTTVEYGHPTSLGPIIARYNLASRFDTQGSMLELEAYPKLRKTTYAYVGLGVSRSSIFPDWRAGAELFQDLGKGFEGSLGIRIIKIPDDNIQVFTGSFGKYVGNFWLNARVFLTPQNESLSRSFNLVMRRYLADADQYFELSGGSGEVPDETLGAEDLNHLGSRRIAGVWQTKITKTGFLQVRLSLENQEIRPDRYRGLSGLNLTYEYRF